MCGFVGELSRHEPIARPILYRMNNSLLHRGPDESGIVLGKDGHWGLAHRRLAVIDLVGGRQPMHSKSHGVTLVFNGEIYDFERIRSSLAREGFAFETSSDTEVLLALYCLRGEKMFEDMRGEFAFALIDERKRELFLARDRFGIKPLFFNRQPDRFLFASEVKALFHHPSVSRAIDPTGLLSALTVADLPGKSIFRGIEEVRHAHFMRVNLDTLEISQHRYWDAFANRKLNVPTDPREQKELVRSAVDEAIRIRLRADVPVGAYLSGGIDSSLVTACMAKQVDKVEAFSLAFEDSPRHNEIGYAADVAKLYPNITLHRIPVTYEETVKRLRRAVYHMERPFGNLHSIAKMMAARYAREHVVCVLTGDGGDESFCGYSTYWLQDQLQRHDYNHARIKASLDAMRKEANEIGGNRYYLAGGLARGIGPRQQFLIDKLGFPPCDLATSIDTESQIRLLLDPGFQESITISPAHQLAVQLSESMPSAREWPHAMLYQYSQLNGSVPEYISIIADRSETSGSIEARLPLFDHHVVELAMGLPIESKINGDQEKFVLREAYRDILPASVVDRRKQAFLAPPAPFSSPEGKALLGRYLSDHAIKAAGIWNRQRIRWLLTARKFAPKNRIINLILTIVLTSQLVHALFVEDEAL